MTGWEGKIVKILDSRSSILANAARSREPGVVFRKTMDAGVGVLAVRWPRERRRLETMGLLHNRPCRSQILAGSAVRLLRSRGDLTYRLASALYVLTIQYVAYTYRNRFRKMQVLQHAARTRAGRICCIEMRVAEGTVGERASKRGKTRRKKYILMHTIYKILFITRLCADRSESRSAQNVWENISCGKNDNVELWSRN